MLGQLAAFVGVSMLVIVTPGPDTALTIRNTILGGRRGGVFTALGVASGQAAWTLAASVGITALLVASEPAFLAVKLVGGVYLVFLGLQALRLALRVGHKRGEAIDAAPRRQLPPALGYRQGLISNLGNPKMAIFFTSLLPQFVPTGDLSFAVLLLLGLVFCLLTLVWLAVYATAVARAGEVLLRPAVRRAVEGVTGTVLVALGVRLATEHR